MNFKLNKRSYNLLETTNCDKLFKSVECIMIQMYETIFILTGYAIIDSKFRILKYLFYVYISCYNLTMVMLCGYYSFVMLINDYDVRDGIKIVFTSIKFMAKFSSTTFIPIFFWKNREKYIMLENSVETLSKHLGIHSKNAVALKYLLFCHLTTVYWLIDSVYIVYSSGSVSSFVHNYPDFVCHVVITKSVLTLSRIAKNFGCVNELFQSIENQNVFYEEFKHVSMVVSGDVRLDMFNLYDQYYDQIWAHVQNVNRNYGAVLLCCFFTGLVRLFFTMFRIVGHIVNDSPPEVPHPSTIFRFVYSAAKSIDKTCVLL